MIGGKSRETSDNNLNTLGNTFEETLAKDDSRTGIDVQFKEGDDGGDESDKYYNVEKILDKMTTTKGVVKYKIKWEGWPESKCTWEPLENLESVQDMVAEFEEQLANKTMKINDTRTETYSAKLRQSRSKEMQVESEDKEHQHDNESKGVSKITELPEEGHLKYKDRPRRIVSMKFEIEQNKTWFLIEWGPREDGRVPKASYMSNEDFKTYDPVYLLEFYETKMVYLTRKKKTGLVNNSNGPVYSANQQNPELELKEKFISDVLMEVMDEGNKNTIF